MKILYLHRSKNFGGFSFEELFLTIKNSLSACDVTDYYDKTQSSFSKNLKAVKQLKSDVIHITGGIGYYALFLPTNKTILTVHDTNHYEYDLKGVKKWIYGWLIYQLPIKNVKYVTVVSEHTKNNLMRFFNIREEKIKVIPNCYPIEFVPQIKNEPNIPFKILQIGTKPNKNIKRLITAIKGLDVELTIIGKINPKLKQELIENRINYINKFNLSRKEIYNEYINTNLVAFVSLREGFGLPIIEANAIGRVVISSNISSMPEVAGDSALLVNPLNINEIKEGIIKLMTDDNYRNQLISKGFDNAKKYHPAIIAKLYEDLYAQINKRKK